VTGATGYVAGWVIERLLDAGLTVHATVRDPSDEAKLAHLRALEPAPGRLRFFAADLLAPGSFAEAMRGCQVVFHTASPFITVVSDPRKQLVDPALLGTRNVLESVDRTPSVERVVLTSSCAAIYGDSIDLAATPRGVFDEEVWNTTSSLDHNPYSYSKTLAEREAWRLHDAQSRWRLVVVNPAMVMGPGIKPDGTSESFSLVKQLGDGTMRSGVPDIRIGVVDVRDLAVAHLRAGFLPNARGRHVIVGHDSSFPEMAAVLRERYGADYPIPKRRLPKPLLWLLGPMVNPAITRPFVSRNVGLPWKSDNGKSVRELGMRYRSLSETMHDFFAQMIASGQLPSRAA
jgi:dihydroflavonol-4-reductase